MLNCASHLLSVVKFLIMYERQLGIKMPSDMNKGITCDVQIQRILELVL